MLSRFALCLKLMVVCEILCPFWHSEVLASFVQFDDPACALSRTSNNQYNSGTLSAYIISALFIEGLSMLFPSTIEGLATALFPSLIRV